MSNETKSQFKELDDNQFNEEGDEDITSIVLARDKGQKNYLTSKKKRSDAVKWINEHSWDEVLQSVIVNGGLKYPTGNRKKPLKTGSADWKILQKAVNKKLQNNPPEKSIQDVVEKVITPNSLNSNPERVVSDIIENIPKMNDEAPKRDFRPQFFELSDDEDGDTETSEYAKKLFGKDVKFPSSLDEANPEDVAEGILANSINASARDFRPVSDDSTMSKPIELSTIGTVTPVSTDSSQYNLLPTPPTTATPPDEPNPVPTADVLAKKKASALQEIAENKLLNGKDIGHEYFKFPIVHKSAVELFLSTVDYTTFRTYVQQAHPTMYRVHSTVEIKPDRMIKEMDSWINLLGKQILINSRRYSKSDSKEKLSNEYQEVRQVSLGYLLKNLNILFGKFHSNSSGPTHESKIDKLQAFIQERRALAGKDGFVGGTTNNNTSVVPPTGSGVVPPTGSGGESKGDWKDPIVSSGVRIELS